ncbi:MAG: hypothetical protein IPP74_12535 [Alphaproteobacteria bacterium]|nr:hypothetical protein [Alphaproteobacteria bacterium]
MNSDAMLQAVIFGINQDGHNYIKLLKDPNSGDEKSKDEHEKSKDEYQKSKDEYEKSLADYEKQPIESTAYQVQGSVKAAVNAWLDPSIYGAK